MFQSLTDWLIRIGPRLQRAFIEGDRWRLYLQGLGTTLELTVIALIFGVLLGLVVAVIRSAHDQQRLGRKRNPLLGILNVLCQIYTTVIRGTPMLVQLFIWTFVIFPTQRNKVLVAFIGLGVNSGAYVAEIIRGGLMSVDAGQSEAGRSLGLNYFDTMRFIVIPQAFKNILPSLGNEFITLFKDTSGPGYRRRGNAVLCQYHRRQDLRLYAAADRHCRDVLKRCHHLHLASGEAGKEAAGK